MFITGHAWYHQAVTAVSLYIHVPFCAHKCPYCDFNAYSGLGRLIEPFVAAVQQEARNWAPLLEGATVETISFGGGTPSLLTSAQIASIIETCAQAYTLAGEVEISLEANPGTLSSEKLLGYRAVGVNRLSLGAQSFDRTELRWLGRDHTADQTARAVEMARDAEFESLNLDLILGLPGQPLSRWEATLRSALALGPDHLSCYALTVEEGTPLARSVASGRAQEPDPDLAADHYLLTEEVLAAAGFGHYEISNWARPGHESRHNTTYWLNEPYVGLGPGAHSYFGGYRFSSVRSPGKYLRAAAGRVLAGGPLEQAIRQASPIADLEVVDEATDLFDTVTQRLRLVRDGVGLDTVCARHGDVAVDGLRPTLDRLIEHGLLEGMGDRFRLTQRGRLLSNEVFLALLEAVRAQGADGAAPAFASTSGR